LRAFSERKAMPGIFVRTALARFGISGPSRYFEFGAARPQARIHQPIFDHLHVAPLFAPRATHQVKARPKSDRSWSCPAYSRSTRSAKVRAEAISRMSTRTPTPRAILCMYVPALAASGTLRATSPQVSRNHRNDEQHDRDPKQQSRAFDCRAGHAAKAE